MSTLDKALEILSAKFDEWLVRLDTDEQAELQRLLAKLLNQSLLPNCGPPDQRWRSRQSNCESMGTRGLRPARAEHVPHNLSMKAA